jgi:predicted nucleic acid-binding protein
VTTQGASRAERTEDASAARRGLLDTSVFIAQETGRPLGTLPEEAAISVITVAELRLGVLMADDPDVRAQRLRTLTNVEGLFEPLPINSAVAGAFAELVAEARRQGRRPKIMDTWIAATAVEHDLMVFTQDNDFLDIPRVRTVRI